MDDVQPVVELGGLSENQVLLFRLELAFQVFEAFEPHQLNASACVVCLGNHAAGFPFPRHFQVPDACLDLNVRHACIQFCYGVNAGAVNIFVGDMVNHILITHNPQFPLEQGSPFFTYAGQKFDI